MGEKALKVRIICRVVEYLLSIFFLGGPKVGQLPKTKHSCTVFAKLLCTVKEFENILQTKNTIYKA